KTDSEGGEMWTNVYGDFYNDYGEEIEFLANGNFLLVGTKQICTGEKNNFSKCKDYRWRVEIDPNGELIQDEVAERVYRR
ncbi:MAG: serine hydrolase, partial [Bacteroidota bacterium]